MIACPVCRTENRDDARFCNNCGTRLAVPTSGQYALEDRTDRWLQIIGPAGTDGLDLSQDARALVAHLTAGNRLEYAFAPGRGGYVYVIDGRVDVDDESLRSGDAIKVERDVDLSITTDLAAELILIDVPLDFTPVGMWAHEL
jgi:redox-sensitive bicupin YhaK (pirin superfamily)